MEEGAPAPDRSVEVTFHHAHMVQVGIHHKIADKVPTDFVHLAGETNYIPASWNTVLDEAFDKVQQKYIKKYNENPRIAEDPTKVEEFVKECKTEIEKSYHDELKRGREFVGDNSAATGLGILDDGYLKALKDINSPGSENTRKAFTGRMQLKGENQKTCMARVKEREMALDEAIEWNTNAPQRLPKKRLGSSNTHSPEHRHTMSNNLRKAERKRIGSSP